MKDTQGRKIGREILIGVEEYNENTLIEVEKFIHQLEADKKMLLSALEAALPYVRHSQVYNVEKWQNDMSKIKEAIKSAGCQDNVR